METTIPTRRKYAALSALLAALVTMGAATVHGDEADAVSPLPEGVPQSAYAEQAGIHVVLDQAKVIRIDHDASTVIIGNPAIADAVLYDRKTLVITGRAFGSTNILILDDNGDLVVDEFIRVRPAADTMVTVHRQTQSYTYSCTPNCRAAVAPGDQNDYYEQAIKQSQARNEFASQISAPK